TPRHGVPHMAWPRASFPFSPAVPGRLRLLPSATNGPRRGFYGSAVALALAVDIGGTKLAAALVTEEGDVAARAQAPTPRRDDADALFRALLAVIDAVGGDGEIDVCGVGTGGPMTAGGEQVSPLNIAAWRGLPLRSRLAHHLG